MLLAQMPRHGYQTDQFMLNPEHVHVPRAFTKERPPPHNVKHGSTNSPHTPTDINTSSLSGVLSAGMFLSGDGFLFLSQLSLL